MKKLGRAVVLLLAAFALIAAGCGGDDASDDTVAGRHLDRRRGTRR